MTAAERAAVDRAMREAPVDLGGDLEAQRPKLLAMLGAVPPPDDVVSTATTIGGIGVVEIDVVAPDRQITDRRLRVLYVHGGAYALGDAATSVGLASELVRRAGAPAVSVDYRLAPEHPAPAAVDDVLAVYTALLDGGLQPDGMVFAGESAGGGLVVAALVAARDRDLPLPAAAAVFSPWVDLTLAGASIATKSKQDPVLTRDALARRAADYAGDSDAADPMISPLFADLTGLPPMMIQAGSHEILLDDAVRLAGKAAAADITVTLGVTAGVPHVFQGFAAMLTEARDALDDAGAFLREHLEN